MIVASYCTIKVPVCEMVKSNFRKDDKGSFGTHPKNAFFVLCSDGSPLTALRCFNFLDGEVGLGYGLLQGISESTFLCEL